MEQDRGKNQRPESFETQERPANRGAQTDALLVKCSSCGALLYGKTFERQLHVCSECGYPGRLGWTERLHQLLDETTTSSFQLFNHSLAGDDPLHLHIDSVAYADKLAEIQQKTGLADALITCTGQIEGYQLAIAVTDMAFLGATMGGAFGEKFVRLVDLAIASRWPLLTISSSGGARIHEGLFGLMQMAKTVSALVRLAEARLPHIALLVDRCYGGVTGSYTMVADVILAEQGASIGFAGPQLIEYVTQQPVPADFQTAAYGVQHGMIDQVVERSAIRSTLARLLRTLPTSADQIHVSAALGSELLAKQREGTPHKPRVRSTDPGQTLLAEAIWQQVQLARHAQRPHYLDYLALLYQNFTELRGDRCFGDDRALLGGFASLDGRNMLVLGQQKGQNLAENLTHNFGMPSPEGYRKATRLLKLAEKFRLPVVCFIDTPGASPGLAGEERGIAQAIAENMRVMVDLRVPIISVIIGEGGSGGALALGIADRILMLEHAIYTITSPEVTALLLWHDVAAAPQAAAALKMTAQDLWQAHLIDEIVAEPPAGAHTDPTSSASLLKAALLRNLTDLEQEQQDDTPSRERLVKQRAAKIRAMGAWREQLPVSS